MVKVELHGSWARNETTGSDLYAFRGTLKQFTPRYGIEKAKFVAPKVNGGQSGTFYAEVHVPGNRYNISLASAVHRAKEVLRYFLQDYTCTPPTLKVEIVEVRQSRATIQVPE